MTLHKQFIYHEGDIEESVRQILQDAKGRIERQELRGSGLRFIAIERVELAVSKYRPLQCSSFIATPKELVKKVCLINVQNDDDACFKWALLSALFPVEKNSVRVSKYKPYQDRINLSNIPLPVPLDRKIFEQVLSQNPDLHFNVFLWDSKEGVLPFFVDPQDPQRAIDLLFLPHPHNSSGHYVWVKNFSRLVAGGISKHHGHYTCRRCFSNHKTQETLDRHIRDCQLITSEDGVKKEVPHCRTCELYDPDCHDCQERTLLKFDNYKAQQIIPAYIVADFEALLSPLPPEDPLAARRGQTDYLREHVPLSYGIKVVVADQYAHLPCFQPFVTEPIRIQCDLEEGLSKFFLENVVHI
jgi:hypothetical protein